MIKPEKTWVLEKWNQYLKNKRTKALSPTDTDYAPSLASPAAAFVLKGQWNDRLKVDWTYFLQSLECEYMKNVCDGIHKTDPGSIVSAEYPELVLAPFLLRPPTGPVERRALPGLSTNEQRRPAGDTGLVHLLRLEPARQAAGMR